MSLEDSHNDLEPCPNSDALMIDLLDSTPGKYVGMSAEGCYGDFELDSLLFPQVAAVSDEPMMTMPDSGFGESETLFIQSAIQSPSSDLFESAPASPFFSPNSSSSSSSESGIEDDSDMEDQICTPPEYATSSSISASTTTVTSLNPFYSQSASSPGTRCTVENASEAGTSANEHKSNVVEAQQELKELLKHMISSPGTLSAHSPHVTESAQTHLVPVYSLPTTTAESTLSTSVSNGPGAVVRSMPVAAQSSQGTTLEQAIIGDPVFTLASVLTPDRVGGRLEDVEGGCSHKCVPRNVPKLVLLEEPEENYRARYESERCRGPIHGSSDNTYPTIQVTGYSGPVWITIHLATSTGIPHYHSIRGPGSTKVPCKEFTLKGGIPAVQVMVAQDTNMTAVLDSLSIRRLRNWEGDHELRRREIDPRTWKSERKEAVLLFEALIPQDNGQKLSILTCKSRIIQCSSYGASGNPEVLWASLSEGSVTGSDELGLIGKKFQSGFKVRFYGELPSVVLTEAIL